MEAYMKKAFFALIILMHVLFPSFSHAFIEKTDTILDDKENAIYMIGSAYSQLTDTGKTLKEGYCVYKVDLKDNSKVIFYEVDKRTMDRLTISPDSNYIAVTRREGELQTEILVIDKKRKISAHSISVPDGILSYAWSPDSKKIAYMTGTYKEYGEINSKGIWLYDLERKEKKKIAEAARSIEWLPTGELCLYVEYLESKGGSRVPFFKTLIYSDNSSKVVSERRGIFLSQDGRYSTDPKYYLLPEDQITDNIVVDFFDLRKGTVILGVTLDKVFSEPNRIAWGGDILWLKETRLVVEKRIPNALPFDISICDFEQNKVLKDIRGRLVGVNSDRSKVVLFYEGKFSVVDVP